MPEKWTAQMQTKLDETIGEIADIKEELGEASQDSAIKAEGYQPAPGTEKLVHLKILKGTRFNPETGKPLATPYIQLFSYGEFQLFKKGHKALGFKVIEVMYDPYNETQSMVEPK